VFLGVLHLGKVTYASRGEAKIVSLWGTPAQIERAAAVLKVVDSAETYCVENLGPASIVRTLPANPVLAMGLGGIDIGTFSEPPTNTGGWGAIIDVQGDAILAFIPVRCRDALRRLLASGDAGSAAARFQRVAQSQPDQHVPERPDDTRSAPSGPRTTEEKTQSSHGFIPAGLEKEHPRDRSATETSATAPPATVVTLTEMAAPSDSNTKDKTAERASDQTQDGSRTPKTVKIVFKPTPKGGTRGETNPVADKATPDNAEDLLDLTLPETVTVIQLLDLVSKHLGLTCVYDPRDIGNQSVVLKLNGNLQGEMKVKNLYALLETVLGSMGLGMIRQQENLVAVVPMDKALQNQPELVDIENSAVQVGDTVVTRAFSVRYVDIASVTTLLQNMKLSVSATSLEQSNLLLVTCHADRMSRIEQLVEMIDRPGRMKECRLRHLYYVAATPLIAKVRTVLQQLRGIEVATVVTTAQPTATPAPQPVTFPARPAEPVSKPTVYLDADERANRLLMIGSEEELVQVEELIDALDVAHEDVRIPKTYNIKNLSAKQALEQLKQLDILKASGARAAVPDKNSTGDGLTWEPVVAVLEATNQLLARATPDQHARIQEALRDIDVIPEDNRTIAAYELQHIKADRAKKILEELDLVAVNPTVSSFATSSDQPGAPAKSETPAAKAAEPGAPVRSEFLAPKAAEPGVRTASVVVNESTNALLVKATAEQHTRIAKIVKYIDTSTPANELTYQMYPLESSAPEHLAGLLERLIVETTKSKDGKIEKVAKTAEQITIVPDPNTFSLIVYASPKDQKWIAGLIQRLDKRRPQVLIDVTLVEVSRTDSFEYDLNLVVSATDAVTGNLVVNPIQTSDSGTRLEAGFNPLDQNGNPTGRTKVFYSDKNVQALLTAIQRKNYGRILAKPKVLVDDGQAGQITTKDQTTYVKESIQIPQTGTPITTRDFVPIDASIQLQITPHISEGDLLRLDIDLSRSDFGTRPLSGAPPDKTTSEVKTTVFVPDDHSVILGGLVRLNQSKGGSKVPILGDVPLVGMLFRSIDNSNVEKKLYVFLKANIVRPYDEARLTDLQNISEEHERAFEESESEFQKLQDIPGIPPKPMPPDGVLRDYK
jgi:type II secretory pathway component GspD/PulD (secretin)